MAERFAKVDLENIDIDMDVLAARIRTMTYKDPLFKVLKSELTALGYWKNKARHHGTPRTMGNLKREGSES